MACEKLTFFLKKKFIWQLFWIRSLFSFCTTDSKILLVQVQFFLELFVLCARCWNSEFLCVCKFSERERRVWPASVSLLSPSMGSQALRLWASAAVQSDSAGGRVWHCCWGWGQLCPPSAYGNTCSHHPLICWSVPASESWPGEEAGEKKPALGCGEFLGIITHKVKQRSAGICHSL